MPQTTIARALDEAAIALAGAGIENPRREARLLLGYALDLSQEALLRDRAASIDPAPLVPLLTRRLRREPLAYILGRQEFWGLPLAVAPATLIPRPDSETLIRAALACFPERKRVRVVLDLGTGTGCLLFAALAEFPEAFGVGVDRVPAAAALVRRNAAMLGLQDRTAFFVGDWAGAIGTRFDLVLCNPPYIPAGDIPRLAPEVAGYEPATALNGGEDGLQAYRILLAQLPGLLTEGGMALLECGAGQAGAVALLAQATGLDPTRTHPDFNGIARAVELRAAGSPKKHLADEPETVSFIRHGRDSRESADPDALVGSIP
jgi:release factor glutamine methyltransferase